jgi:uncharacterized delta-60 repeat protein
MKTNPSFFTKPCLALSLALGLLPAFLYSQDPSRPDLGFGVNGVAVNVALAGTPSTANKVAVAVDSQGRIVTVGTAISGSSYIHLIRHLPDGRLDTSFGTGGKAVIPFGTVKGVAIDKDDHIVVVLDLVVSGSQKDIRVYRLLGSGPNAGDPDLSFGPANGGYVLSTLNASSAPVDSNAGGIAIQEDGRIVIAGDAFNPAATNNGTRDLIVVRLTPQGFDDPSFNAGSPLYFGNLQEEFAAGVAVDSQGRIVVAARHNAFARVYRVTANGLPDTSVGTPNGGFEHLDAAVMLGNNVVPTGIAVHSDDSVVVCGHQSGAGISGTNKLWVAKYATEATSATWVTEEDFGADTEGAFELALQSDSKIVVAGFSSGPPGTAVIRYLSDGSRDTSFNQDFGGFAANLTGGINETATGVAIQGNGGIVLAGCNTASFFAARIGAPRLTTAPVRRFRAGPVNQSVQAGFATLSNSGSALLTGLQYRVVGGARRDYRILPSATRSIAAGGSTRTGVEFRPKRQGARNAILQVSTANGGSATVRLTGRGK